MLSMGYRSKNKEKDKQEPRSIPIPYPELLMSFLRWIGLVLFWRSRVSGITSITRQVECAQLKHTENIPILAGASTNTAGTNPDDPMWDFLIIHSYLCTSSSTHEVGHTLNQV